GLVAGGAPLDVTGEGVRNLGGSLSEWVDDAVASYGDACWHPDRTLLVDPSCDTARPGFEAGRMNRGGSWEGVPSQALTLQRQYDSKGGSEASIGFRCAASF